MNIQDRRPETAATGFSDSCPPCSGQKYAPFFLNAKAPNGDGQKPDPIRDGLLGSRKQQGGKSNPVILHSLPARTSILAAGRQPTYGFLRKTKN
jgi:hypothetical protein